MASPCSTPLSTRTWPDAAGGDKIVSGECPLGGVDVWAHEAADELGVPFIGFAPKSATWEGGYKPRNLMIAKVSRIVHCIVVDQLPEGFDGLRHSGCYHCLKAEEQGRVNAPDGNRHVKCGGCWTAIRARSARWHLVWNHTIGGRQAEEVQL